MRYYRVKNDQFLQNGRSVLRLGQVLTMPSPVSSGRIVKVFEILQVMRASPTNPAPPRGAMIALSFPAEKLHSDQYAWGPLEESQVPYEIKDRKTNIDALSAKRN